MNEAETRAEHIEPALKTAGWGVVEGSRIRREYPITLGRIEGERTVLNIEKGWVDDAAGDGFRRNSSQNRRPDVFWYTFRVS